MYEKWSVKERVKNVKRCDYYNIRKVTRYTYHPLTGRPISHTVDEAYSGGTKECDVCSCNGDRTKCDFYEDVRKDAKAAARKKAKAATHKKDYVSQKTVVDILDEIKKEFYYEFDEIIPSIMADKIDAIGKRHGIDLEKINHKDK